MDNDSNFDDAFVKFSDCPGQEEVNICCTPWTETKLRASLQPVPGVGGLGSNYGIDYQSVSASNSAMQAYANYVDIVNPTFSNLQVLYRAKSFGSGTTPNSSPLSVPGVIDQTITHTGTTTSTASFWGGTPFQQNIWYGFQTRVTAHDAAGNDLNLFNKEVCPHTGVYYRVQSMSARTAIVSGNAPLLLQISDGKRILATKEIKRNSGKVPIRARPVQIPDRFKR